MQTKAMNKDFPRPSSLTLPPISTPRAMAAGIVEQAFWTRFLLLDGQASQHYLAFAKILDGKFGKAILSAKFHHPAGRDNHQYLDMTLTTDRWQFQLDSDRVDSLAWAYDDSVRENPYRQLVKFKGSRLEEAKAFLTLGDAERKAQSIQGNFDPRAAAIDSEGGMGDDLFG
jgi:hypothetical protein